MAYAGPLKKITVYKTIVLKVTLERDETWLPMTDQEFEEYVTDIDTGTLVTELCEADPWVEEYDPREFSNYKPGIQYTSTVIVGQKEYGELDS